MKVSGYKNSLLYKISGNSLKKPSYLFGTMHMICAKNFSVPEKVRSAMSKCSVYYMEVDLGSVHEVHRMDHADSMATNWLSTLSENETTELTQIAEQRLGISYDQLQEASPMSLVNQMTLAAIGCEDILVAELELLKLARGQGLKTAGIETALEQMKIAEKVFTGKELLIQLRSTENYKELFRKMTDAYQHEKLNELAGLITDKQFMSKRAFNILVKNRNKKWEKKIPSLIKAQSCFIAVGAGHLPGDSGLISALARQGFSVNPVYR